MALQTHIESKMSARKKNIVYCGGIDQTVNEEILQAAFIPFGDIKSIQIPKDFVQGIAFLLCILLFSFYFIGKSRGFAFIEFESEEDAADALENMNGAELFGKVLHCNIAKAQPKLAEGKAVWNAEEWIAEHMKDAERDQGDTIEFSTLVPEST